MIDRWTNFWRNWLNLQGRMIRLITSDPWLTGKERQLGSSLNGFSPSDPRFLQMILLMCQVHSERSEDDHQIDQARLAHQRWPEAHVRISFCKIFNLALRILHKILFLCCRLEAVHPDAYRAYQASNDLRAVIDRCLDGDFSAGTSTSIKDSPKKAANNVTILLSLMTPVLPMLVIWCS